MNKFLVSTLIVAGLSFVGCSSSTFDAICSGKQGMVKTAITFKSDGTATLNQKAMGVDVPQRELEYEKNGDEVKIRTAGAPEQTWKLKDGGKRIVISGGYSLSCNN